MNQVELVIQNLVERITESEKELAVTRANLQVALARIEELENPKESDNG